jgi:hypothetical protein
MVSRHLFLLALGLIASTLRAQTEPPPPDPQTPAQPRPLFSRISGIFSGDLPQLDPPGTMKLILRPHFGDLIRRDYMRVDTGFRWALNDHFDLSSEAAVFFTHGLGDSAGNGIGKLRFDSKYIFERWPRPDFETSVGLTVELPVGHPPLDMTDGHNHISPTVVVQHLWTRVPHLTTFAGTGVDFISNSTAIGTFARNQPHENSISVTAGGVYDLGQLKWTLSGTYATTALISNAPNNFFYLQPGVLWYVPRQYTLRSKTQWIIGLTARTTRGPDGTEFSLGSRLRAEITFRQVMDKLWVRNGDKH